MVKNFLIGISSVAIFLGFYTNLDASSTRLVNNVAVACLPNNVALDINADAALSGYYDFNYSTDGKNICYIKLFNDTASSDRDAFLTCYDFFERSRPSTFSFKYHSCYINFNGNTALPATLNAIKTSDNLIKTGVPASQIPHAILHTTFPGVNNFFE